MSAMRVGALLAFDGGNRRGMDALADCARHAEDVGLSSFWVPEHVVFIDGAASKYPYSVDGSANFGRRPGVYDPLIALTVAATATTRIRLGTGVMILPQREPVTLAQQVVALDHASNGRFDLGIGVGWLREESEALGVPWARRGARTEDYVRAIRALWRDDVVAHDGEFAKFSAVLAWPKPTTASGPPIIIGGNTDAALARVASVGDGWFGWNLSIEEVRERLDALRSAWASAHRGEDALRITVGLLWAQPIAGLMRYACELANLGVDELVVAVAAPRVDNRERLDDLAALVAELGTSADD